MAIHISALKPICPYTLTDNPGKMRSQTYLPIHLPTTPERCGLKPTCPYTLTNKPGKMRSQTYLPIHSYRQHRNDAVSKLPAHALLLTTPERCGLKPTYQYTLTNKPGKMRSQTYLPIHLPTTPERCGL